MLIRSCWRTIKREDARPSGGNFSWDEDHAACVESRTGEVGVGICSEDLNSCVRKSRFANIVLELFVEMSDMTINRMKFRMNYKP